MPQRPATPEMPEIGVESFVRFRLERQRLIEPASGERLAELVSSIGWLQSASGLTPYLSLFARSTSFHREDLDRAIFEEHELLELPGARTTTFVVPAAEGLLCLFCYARDVEARAQKLRQSARLTDAEVEKIENAIRSTLSQGPLPLEELRAKIPQQDNRDLGTAGQSTGYRNVLSVALARLLGKGVVLKVASEGRLDRGRYVYMPSRKIAGDQRLRPVGPAETARRLASLYFAAAGPATLEDFAWWAALSAEEARAAVNALGREIAGVRVAGERAPMFVPAASLEALKQPPAAHEPVALFLPHGDNLFAMRRGTSLNVRREHAGYPVLDWRGETIPAGVAGAANHAPVVVDGYVTGAWEFDPQKGKVRWETFEPQPEEIASRLEARAESLETFLRDEIGSPERPDALTRPGRVSEMAKLWRSLNKPPAKRRVSR